MSKNATIAPHEVSNLPTILVVDDSVDTCKLISEFLSLHHYPHHLAHNAAQAIEQIHIATPDLILLDIMLPDIDGLTLMKALKSHDIDVIFLSGETQIETKIKGLELGAQDYITKPFHLRELLARINTVSKRKTTAIKDISPPAKTPHMVITGEWQIDTTSRHLLYQDTVINLTNNEYKLFQFLLKNSNEDMSREQISQAVYDADWHPNARRIDTLIYQLRNKLKQYPDGPCIKSLYNQGYTMLLTAAEQ